MIKSERRDDRDDVITYAMFTFHQNAQTLELLTKM